MQHIEKYKAYKDSKPKSNTQSQPLINAFFKCSNQENYSNSHPRQRKLSMSIVENLIVGCSLPIRIVENKHFRTFMEDVDSKYSTPCRKTVTNNYLPLLLQQKQAAVNQQLSSATDVALTIDLWTDRRQHAFMGVTGHFFGQSGTLSSCLVQFKAFAGSHTGEKIAEVLEEVCNEKCLRDKVSYIVTDNASNMKKAATFLFEDTTEGNNTNTILCANSDGNLVIAENDAVLDDPTLYEDMSLDELPIAADVLKGERLPCFAHSLQLTVRDGLSKITLSRSATAKCSKLASLVHQSPLFKEAFEKTYGKNRSITQVNDTRWNSFYNHIASIVALEKEQNKGKLADLLKKQSHGNLILTQRELQQLNELVDILEPFSDATDITQGDTYVTISCVVPTVISLGKKLDIMETIVQFQQCLIRELRRSLYERFRGIYEMLELPVPEGVVLTTQSAGRNLHFNSEVYLTACVIDPLHGYRWMVHLDLSLEQKETLKCKIYGKDQEHILL